MTWHTPQQIPPKPDVYRVQVPMAMYGNFVSIDEHFARWTGVHWCTWALTPQKAAMCTWRGPTAGYCWAERMAVA
jgi:hypothetical protein